MTDAFTTAAREEAAEDAANLWTHRQGYAMTGTEWGAFEQGHLSGTAWARTRLAAQEPTDAESIARKNLGDAAVDRLAAHFGVAQEPTAAEVEAAAEVIHYCLTGNDWSDAPPHEKAEFHLMARDALRAALSAARNAGRAEG